jgi:crotonobetainyl-CoA:carnitine CoA-transferase CaiB-like acyl-CoA transferase
MIVAPIGDRYLAMQFTGSGELWPRLLAVMGRSELGHDPRFDTAEKRRTNWRELRPIVESWLGTFASVEDARKTLSEARIPCAPVLRPAEVVAEPHMAERQFFPSVPHPARGAVRVTASPYHIDGEPVHPRGPAAYRVGEHTRAVLGDLLGYSPERIAELARQGVIDAP